MPTTTNEFTNDNESSNNSSYRRRFSDQKNNSTTNTNSNKEKNDVLYLFLVNASKLWQQSIHYLDAILIQFGIYNLLDSIAYHLAKHPFLAFGVSATVISIALPFLIFMIFAMTTVIMTFTGFVVIEGTLITIASIMLFGFLGAVILVFLFFGCCILAAYFGFMHIYDLFDRKFTAETKPTIKGEREVDLNNKTDDVQIIPN